MLLKCLRVSFKSFLCVHIFVADVLLRLEVKCFKVQAPINSLNETKVRTCSIRSQCHGNGYPSCGGWRNNHFTLQSPRQRTHWTGWLWQLVILGPQESQQSKRQASKKPWCRYQESIFQASPSWAGKGPSTPTPRGLGKSERWGYWPVLKDGCDADDPELTKDAAKSQVGVLGILQWHHPREFLVVDQTLLGSFHNVAFLDATTCRKGVWGPHHWGKELVAYGHHRCIRPQDPLSCWFPTPSGSPSWSPLTLPPPPHFFS